MHDSDAKAHWLENKQITNSSIPRCLTLSNVLELKINTASVYFGKTTGAGEKNDSVVSNISYSCRGPELGTWHPRWGALNQLRLSSRGLRSLQSSLKLILMHTSHTHTCNEKQVIFKILQ